MPPARPSPTWTETPTPSGGVGVLQYRKLGHGRADRQRQNTFDRGIGDLLRDRPADSVPDDNGLARKPEGLVKASRAVGVDGPSPDSQHGRL